MRKISDHIDFDAYNDVKEDHANVHPASRYGDAVYDAIHGEDTDHGIYLPWKRANWFRLRPHETSIWAGINGHGKSLLLGQVMLHAMSQGDRVCIASMEMPAHTTLSRMCRQATGEQKPSREQVNSFGDWTDDHLWIFDQIGTISPRRIVGVVKYAIHELGVQHFVIDSVMKCGINPEDMGGEKDLFDELTTVSKNYPVHIHVIDHIRKQQNEYGKPGKFDVRGAGIKTDMVDNVIIVYRNKRKEHEIADYGQDGKKEILNQPDAYLLVEKQRNGTGLEGQLGFWFHRDSMQYQSTDNPDPQHSISFQSEGEDDDPQR